MRKIFALLCLVATPVLARTVPVRVSGRLPPGWTATLAESRKAKKTVFGVCSGINFDGNSIGNDRFHDTKAQTAADGSFTVKGKIADGTGFCDWHTGDSLYLHVQAPDGSEYGTIPLLESPYKFSDAPPGPDHFFIAPGQTIRCAHFAKDGDRKNEPPYTFCQTPEWQPWDREQAKKLELQIEGVELVDEATWNREVRGR
jgi:hypothetical protein